MSPVAIFIAALAVVLIAVLVRAVKIVRPYQQGLVERLGRYKTTKQPGFNLIVPFMERIEHDGEEMRRSNAKSVTRKLKIFPYRTANNPAPMAGNAQKRSARNLTSHGASRAS